MTRGMSKRTAVKIALFLLIAAGVTALWFSPLRAYFAPDRIRGTIGQLRDSWYGPVILISLYAVGCIFAVPASVFILSAGIIWGWKLGGTYAMIGGLLGATASFMVGRFIGEGLLERFGRLGCAVRKQVDHAGFGSLLILRVIPLFPFAVLNYGAGVAGVRLVDFFFATMIGLAPSNYVFAYSADSLFNGTLSQGDVVKRVLTVAALMLTVVLVPMFLKKRLRPAGVGQAIVPVPGEE
jgi:uncharacterized membrane protein YdjX (TVP38/TMEM64 family)